MELQHQVGQILRGTQKLLLPKYGNVRPSHQKSDSPYDIVTEIDIAVEHYLARELKSVRSGAAFVGEEGGGDRNAPEFWLSDPIDGTAHFVRGMPFCTTMIALIREGEIVFSAIYDFLRDQLYMAERGKGATVNGTPIHVSSRGPKSFYFGCEMKSHLNGNAERHAKLKQLGEVFETITAGFEFAMVASGRLEGRICVDPWGQDYDYAPGAFLVKEAGGVVANIGMTSYDFRNLNLIAANRELYKTLTEGSEALFPVNR